MNKHLSAAIHNASTLTKVPEITVYFWIIKVLTTGMGEVTSDYLAHQLNPVIAVAIAGIGLVATLVMQFSVRRYVAWIYWLNVVMVSIFGTMAADVLHVGFGIPYLTINHVLCGSAGNYLRNMVCEREDSVYTQHLHSPSRSFLLDYHIGHVRTRYCCRRYDCSNHALGLFLLGCAVCPLNCYPGSGLLAVWS